MAKRVVWLASVVESDAHLGLALTLSLLAHTLRKGAQVELLTLALRGSVLVLPPTPALPAMPPNTIGVWGHSCDTYGAGQGTAAWPSARCPGAV